MALGERIKECRQNAGMSQEKVAELVGVSRQAVTKWEVNQSAPNTENLFKLAEIFGTTVDLLLDSDEGSKQSPAEQIYYLYKMEEEKKSEAKKKQRLNNVKAALLVTMVYILVYLVGRFVWLVGLFGVISRRAASLGGSLQPDHPANIAIYTDGFSAAIYSGMQWRSP